MSSRNEEAELQMRNQFNYSSDYFFEESSHYNFPLIGSILGGIDRFNDLMDVESSLMAQGQGVSSESGSLEASHPLEPSSP